MDYSTLKKYILATQPSINDDTHDAIEGFRNLTAVIESRNTLVEDYDPVNMKIVEIVKNVGDLDFLHGLADCGHDDINEMINERIKNARHQILDVLSFNPIW